MSPPIQDGTCEACEPDDVSGRFWARILGKAVVFGCLLALAGGVFCAVYALVWLSRRSP